MTTRIVVLTCMRRDYASRCLPVLAATPGLVVDRVILAHGGTPGRGRLRLLWRKLVKIARIGPLGAWNGVRMRPWFEDREAEDLGAVCARLSIPLVETPYLNCDTTRAAMRAANADIGLSLGNGYIAKSVFSIPRLGMLNIHTEILPDYQGAQSVLWALHDGRTETGFTIHRIATSIDTGDIVHQERYPIVIAPSLAATVERTLAIARARVPHAFATICSNLDLAIANATPQTHGRQYTTPSWRAYRRMLRAHARLSSATAEFNTEAQRTQRAQR